MDKGSGVPGQAQQRRMRDYCDSMLKDIRRSHKEREDQLSQAAQGFKKRLQNTAHSYEMVLVAYRYSSFCLSICLCQISALCLYCLTVCLSLPLYVFLSIALSLFFSLFPISFFHFNFFSVLPLQTPTYLLVPVFVFVKFAFSEDIFNHTYNISHT